MSFDRWLARLVFGLAVLSSFLIVSRGDGTATAQNASRGGAKVVKVFVLAGQSNMQGQGVVDLDHPQHYNGGRGTLSRLMTRPDFKQQFGHLHNAAGEWTVRDDVWVRYKTEKEIKRGPLSIGFTGYEGHHHIGPELQFGHIVGEALSEPVLLIKTAWGGKSLYKDFRPPSAGGETGAYYQKMLEEVDEALRSAATEFPALADAQIEIAGFVWQQGWNDMVDEAARNEYGQNLICLINDIRRAWDRPHLPVVIGELGNGGPDASEPMKQIRRAQSSVVAHPPFVGNVALAETRDFARPADQSPNVGHGHHWFGNAESYILIGDALAGQMLRLTRMVDQPRVLILGDSISIGYAPHVQQLLQDQAFVVRPMRDHRNHENCQGTKYGVQHVDRWLSMGGGNWDVIHFNFGLHDMKHVNADTGKNSNSPSDPPQSTLVEYQKQLAEIVSKLKQTDAKLIFATTTPVPPGDVRPFRSVDAPPRYNEAAVNIMRDHNIAVNDLYSFAAGQLDQIQRPANVHFTAAGSIALAEQVAQQIRLALDP